MNIQKISAIVLLVVLIITMIVVYAMLYYSNKNLQFPPKINNCPDTEAYNGTICDGGATPYLGGDVCEAQTKNNDENGGNWDGITNADCD